MKAEAIKVEISPKGTPVLVNGLRVGENTFIVSGKRVRTARLKNEWQEDVTDPYAVMAALRSAPLRIDLLNFWQRIPDQEVKFPFYHEWRDVAAIPITTFEHWWEKQIRFRARNKMRKAQKLGVVVEEVKFNDDFVAGVVEIYNQSPVRRGKPFRHYGKDFATVKAELSVDLDEAVFVGAYHEGELIGFVKFLIADRYAMVTLILDKIVHRDKSPMNGMMAKVVEICARRKIPYFTYTLWRRGDHGKFQESVGFEKFPVPEYYIPLTLVGRAALALRLHKGVIGAVPEPVVVQLLAWRANYYERKYAGQIPRPIANRSASETSRVGEAVDTGIHCQ